MKPKRYPYSGFEDSKRSASVDEFGIVAFPNIAFGKKLLKYIYTVVKNHDDTTIIYFRIPKILGYEEQKAKINLSYENVIRILDAAN